MIVGYDVMYKFFIDRDSGQFKAPINTINNEARVFTPKDTAISTPNSDTPYSMAMLDLRAEPIVPCMPDIEKARYYDVQLIDLYTNNFGGGRGLSAAGYGGHAESRAACRRDRPHTERKSSEWSAARRCEPLRHGTGLRPDSADAGLFPVDQWRGAC
jgi:hypothetical protein